MCCRYSETMLNFEQWLYKIHSITSYKLQEEDFQDFVPRLNQFIIIVINGSQHKALGIKKGFLGKLHRIKMRPSP